MPEWDDARAWSISQATEEALRRLRPEGHALTPDESRKLSRLLEKRHEASEGQDMISYLRASADLLGAACRSYSRHLTSSGGSSKRSADAKRVGSR